MSKHTQCKDCVMHQSYGCLSNADNLVNNCDLFKPAKLSVTSEQKITPLYKHDCPDCEFLGRYRTVCYSGDTEKRTYDLYVCGSNVVARSDDEGPDYISGIHMADTVWPLKEAKARAERNGVVFDTTSTGQQFGTVNQKTWLLCHNALMEAAGYSSCQQHAVSDLLRSFHNEAENEDES